MVPRVRQSSRSTVSGWGCLCSGSEHHPEIKLMDIRQNLYMILKQCNSLLVIFENNWLFLRPRRQKYAHLMRIYYKVSGLSFIATITIENPITSIYLFSNKKLLCFITGMLCNTVAIKLKCFLCLTSDISQL